jgi:molybdopterin adenylyltransferase
VGGLANGTLIFALPGSRNAVRTGWEKILRQQLDSRFRPCNFAELIPRFKEA